MVASSVYSGILQSVSTISESFKLKLAPSIKPHKLFIIFPVIQWAVDSGISSYHITSFWMLLIRKLISLIDIYTGIGAAAHATFEVDQTIKWDQPTLILSSPYRVLKGMLSQFHRFVTYMGRVMIFWIRQYVCGLGMWLIFLTFFLILFSGNVMDLGCAVSVPQYWQYSSSQWGLSLWLFKVELGSALTFIWLTKPIWFLLR